MGSKSCKQPSSIEQKKVGHGDAQRLTAWGRVPQSRRLSCFCWYHVPRYCAVKFEILPMSTPRITSTSTRSTFKLNFDVAFTEWRSLVNS